MPIFIISFVNLPLILKAHSNLKSILETLDECGPADINSVSNNEGVSSDSIPAEPDNPLRE